MCFIICFEVCQYCWIAILKVTIVILKIAIDRDVKNTQLKPPTPLVHTASYVVDVYIGLKLWHCISCLISIMMSYMPCMVTSVSSNAESRAEGPVSPHRASRKFFVAEVRLVI